MGRARVPAKSISLSFHSMDEVAARIILTWRYEAPYDVYNLNLDDADEVVNCFVDPVNAYHTVVDEGERLVAYCCFGPDARVPGGDYSSPALDVGLGVHPDLTGQGHGSAFVGAVLRFARQKLAPTEFRVTVAEFNERASRVWEKARFSPVQRFGREADGMPFVVLTKKVPGRPWLAGRGIFH